MRGPKECNHYKRGDNKKQSRIKIPGITEILNEINNRKTIGQNRHIEKSKSALKIAVIA